MDLVELTSTLIIPFLLSAKHDPKTERTVKLLRRPSFTSGAGAFLRRQNSASLSEEADDVDVIQDALTHILEDCTGDGKPKPLTEELVKDVLRGFGEGALAKDDELVREMVEVATSGSSLSSRGSPDKDMAPRGPLSLPNGPRLDLGAFIEALTSDVDRLYDPGRYKRSSTNFEDVWFRDGEEDDMQSSRTNRLRPKPDVEGGARRKDEPAELREQKLHEKFQQCCSRSSAGNGKNENGRNIVHRLYTGQAFDYTNDNYRTRFHLLFLWVAFAAFWVAYLGLGALGGGYKYGECEKEDLSGSEAVTCPLVRGIVNQLLMISELVLFGGPFIFLGSTANSIEGRETFLNIAVGSLLFLLYVVIFYSADFSIQYWITTENNNRTAYHMALATGMIVSFLQVFHFIMRFFREKFPLQQWYKKYFTFGNVHYEATMKRSGLFKIRRMLHNAHVIHRRIIKQKEMQAGSQELHESSSNFLSNFGKALNEFIKLEAKSTYIGGIGWTWKKMRDGTLFEEEGIWITGRMAVGTVFQILLIFLSPVAYYFVLPGFLKTLNEESDELSRRARVALWVGVVCSFLTSISVTVLFIPGVVSTTLKFRRGALPTLRSEDFLHRYRFALDQATLVYGGMFWGTLFSSVAIALISGGFVYILMWEQTSSFVLGIVGNLLGLSSVLISKIIVMQIIRFTHYAAYYRKKPFSSNVMTVVLECYAIGISVWFMVVRTIKIIVIGALYLGRIDTPLFSPGVGIFGPLEIDNWPTVTRKEILIHEAHRHPYIETLGYLYMMQLRYRNGFARRACSTWRLVFVLSLMPWLHKYRDLTRPEHFGDDNDDSGKVSKKQNSLFGNDTNARRILMQSVVSPQFGKSSRALMDQIFEENDNADTKHDGAISDNERESQIKEEMKRLQNELDAIEARASSGQESPL
mmetsp:Transcript_36531/g.109787  ORF Transcript_36531/g.109787 Transcript_36531/m.109787 type:complete len:920 (-) Transcript_36531:445-3204(-)